MDRAGDLKQNQTTCDERESKNQDEIFEQLIKLWLDDKIPYSELLENRTNHRISVLNGVSRSLANIFSR